jgi:hypothetical protein
MSRNRVLPVPPAANVPLFVVKGESESGPAKYWTGKMNGRWPEYVRDRDRAVRVSKGVALSAATEFESQVALLTWTAEPAS